MANYNYDYGEVFSGDDDHRGNGGRPQRRGNSSAGGTILFPASHVSTVVSKTDVEKKRLRLDANQVQVHIVPNLEIHQRMALMSEKKPVAIPAIDAQTGQAYWPSLYLGESNYVLNKVSNIMRDSGLAEGDKIMLWHQGGVTMFYVQNRA